MSTERIAALETLLLRVVARGAEPRNGVASVTPEAALPLEGRMVAASSHLVVMDDDVEGLDINLVDDLPSSTSLPVADQHDMMMFDDLMSESASRLIASEGPPAAEEPPPRHTPPPESGPLPTPIEGDLEPIEVEEATSTRPRDGAREVEHVEADLRAFAPRIEIRGSLQKTRFADVLDASLALVC